MLDSEGIDISVMYPGMGLKLGGIVDPELAVWSCKVFNDWMAEWCAAAPDRLKGVGALPMQDPVEAAREVQRIRELGLVGTFCRPNAYNDRPFHDPVYTPVWEALEESTLPSACTSPDSRTCPARRRRCCTSWRPARITRSSP